MKHMVPPYVMVHTPRRTRCISYFRCDSSTESKDTYEGDILSEGESIPRPNIRLWQRKTNRFRCHGCGSVSITRRAIRFRPVAFLVRGVFRTIDNPGRAHFQRLSTRQVLRLAGSESTQPSGVCNRMHSPLWESARRGDFSSETRRDFVRVQLSFDSLFGG